MPELPEVEVTRRSIAGVLAGALTRGASLGKPLRWPLGCETAGLVGRRIGDVQRRGKYLWLPLSARAGHGSTDAGGLLLHLGMSGSLVLAQDAGPAGPHDHFDLQTNQGLLRLHDPRRFGAVVWAGGLDQAPAVTLLARLGKEPFDASLTPREFHQALHRRKVAIKPLLLAGDIVVGAGNIYACEALFKAGIDPRTPAARLSLARAERLLAAVRAILTQALDLGGTTLRDFRDAHGMNGAFQDAAAVYGREGAPCRLCGHAIQRIQQAQRSTYFCAHCQRR